MFVAAAGETFWKGGFDSFFLVSMGIFYNIPRFPRYFYRFSVRSVSLKIKLIVIPGLLYGFSKYPLVWIETVAHEIRISTPYFLRNSCFCKMLNNRKIQIYAFWRGVLCVLTSFEVWCSVFLDLFRITYYKLIAGSPTRFDLDKWHRGQAFPQAHNSSRDRIAFRFTDLSFLRHSEDLWIDNLRCYHWLLRINQMSKQLQALPA